MILVHRLSGEALFLNADLVEAVEATPDTVLTLVDGRRVMVLEPPTDVIAAIVRFRASVLVAADELRTEPRPALRAVPGLEE